MKLPEFRGIILPPRKARMVKLVDTPDLGSGAAMRAGSSPVPGIFQNGHPKLIPGTCFSLAKIARSRL